jgi:protease I
MARVAIVVEDMFEDSEFRVPYDRLRRAGHEVVVVGVEAQKDLEGEHHKERITTGPSIREVAPRDFDALVIPGGYSPDRLRLDPLMVELTRQMFIDGKPVAAICHAGSLLVEADIAEGRTLTSWPSIRTDLLNAGAHWIDQDIVEDGNLITARMPADLGVFGDAILRQLEGRIPARISPLMPPEGEGSEGERPGPSFH